MSGRQFEQQKVIVTGGASGIGEAIAEAFAVEGADVVVADISNDNAETVAQRLRANGGKARPCTVDVADESAVAEMFALVDDTLDVLVCAAGMFIHGSVEQTSLDDWRRIIDVNFTGTFLCAKAAIPLMRANGGGSIVTISSSTGAHDANADSAAYVASKGGVTLLTKAMAVDHAEDGIRVNCIAPGPTDTPMLRGLMDEPSLREFAASLPIKRLATPDELAGAALFLSSEAASFVTGTIMAVDGGQTALI